MWYLIVSISDKCTHTFFHTQWQPLHETFIDGFVSDAVFQLGPLLKLSFSIFVSQLNFPMLHHSTII